MKLRDDSELFALLYDIIATHDDENRKDDREGYWTMRVVDRRKDAVSRILDAIDRRTPAAPPEPPRTRYECPLGCLRGLPIHSDGCPNKPAATPGTAPTTASALPDDHPASAWKLAGTPRGDE